MTHTHDPALVTTSVLVAMLASYVALDLAGRVATASGRARAGWLLGGSVAMGGGIWSMHFIAMLAFTLAVPIAYDVPLVLLSVVAAILASAVALFTLCREGELGWPRLLGAGLVMGAAIVGMHYTGMAAMRLAAELHYDPVLLAASAVIAVVASVAALWIASHLRHDGERSGLGWRAGAAVVMGVAIAGMHYTGMAAARFTIRADLTGIEPNDVVAGPGLTAAVVSATLLILGIAIVSSLVDRALQRRADDAAALALLAAIVESSSDAIESKSLDGVVLSWNAAAERLYGYTATEIVGQPVTLLARPGGAAEIAAHLERVGRGERIENFETVRRRKDGVLIDVSVTLSPITDAAGQITGISTIARDISERRRVDAALRASQERYELVARATNDIIRDWDLATNALHWNDAIRTVLGYAEADVGRDAQWWLDHLHPDDLAWVGAGVHAVLDHGGEFWSGEYRLRRADGSYAVMFDRGYVVRDASGRPVRMIGAMSDITSRKLVEERLRESEQQLAEAQAMAHLGSWQWDVANGAVTWSDEMYRIYGRERQAFTPTYEGFLACVHPEDRARVAGLVEAAFAGGQPLEYEARTVWPDGTVRTFYARGAVTRDGAGTATRMVGINSDITERKRAEETERAAREAAEAATRAKSEFLANMSHEIRTPMNGVVGMLELALDGELASEQRAYLEVARSSADALLTVINDILDFSKIEAGRLELAPAPFGLRDALGDAVRSLALQADGKGVELALHVLSEVPDGLVGDVGRLRQVVVNLVGNAIKFTHRGEVVVTVDTVPRDGDAAGAPGRPDVSGDDVVVHVAVRDTGVGIAPEKQQLVFGAFQQADSSTTREFGGTGLGLAISSQLVALMGGRIWLESEVGRGSTFHFTMRLARHTRRAGTPIATVAVRPPALRGMRVLVVDDNATNRRILEQTVTNWGMLPTVVDGGVAALAALRAARAEGGSFHLVLLDANMPEMDGFELAARIRECPQVGGATVMMLSSAGQQRGATRCRELDIAAFLTKPVKASDLLKSISTVLGVAATAAAPAVPAAAARGQMAIEPGGRPLRLLLVDDNAVNRRLGVALLERRGHSVGVAENGQLALAALERETFDLVLMDVHMPMMGGFEATAAIREQERATGAHLPVVAMTARAMAGDREQCLAAGMDGYVAKPIQPAELFEVIEQLVARMGTRPAADAPDGARFPAERNDLGYETPDVGVFDRQAFHGIVGGDEQLMRELVDIFLRELPEMRAAVRIAVAQSDLRALESAAHALKGTVGSLAAAHAFAAALTLETLARQGRAAGVDAALATLEEELARLERALSTPLTVTMQ